MTNFPVHTMDSAPERSKPALRQLQSAFGMIPNIAGAMATSPVLINSLVGLFQNVHGGSFTEAQVQTVLLTDAVTNACTWAVAFHTALALKQGIDPADVAGDPRASFAEGWQACRAVGSGKNDDRKARASRRSGCRSIHRGRFRQRSCPGGHRHRRRIHDHELHRQHHEDASRGAVSGSRLDGLRSLRSAVPIIWW